MTPPLLPGMPTPQYRVGLTAAPLDAQSSITWTYITSFTPADGIERLRVLSRSTSAGKAQGQATVDTSKGVYVLDNRDGAFYPSNTSSPYYPNVKLDMIFQELQTWAGTTYAVYTGYVDDIQVQADVLGNPTVRLSCSDASKHLNLDKLEGSVWDIEVRKDVAANISAGHNTAWLRLNDANSSEVMTDYGGLGFDGDYQNGPVLGQKSIIAGSTDTCMDVANKADQRASLPYKHLLTQWPFTIELVMRLFQNRGETHALFGAYDGPSLGFAQQLQAFVYTDGKIVVTVTNPYPTGSQSRSTIIVDDGVEHHVAIVMASAASLRVWIDGADFTSVDVGATFAFPDNLLTGIALGNLPATTFGEDGFDAGVSVDPLTGNDITGGLQSFVFYDGLALSSARIQKHASAAKTGWGTVGTGSRVDQVLDTIGWPVADRAVDAGSGSVGNIVSGSTPLAYLQLVAQTEGGRFFIGPEGYPTFHSRTRPLTQTTSTTPQAVFDDAGGSGSIPYVPPFDPHLDDVDLTYRASVTRINGSPQIYDATPGSTSTRTSTKTGLLMPTDIEARGMAQYDVSVGKVQKQRIRSLVFQPQLSPTTGWPAALGLRQGQRITVKRNFEGTAVTWQSDWIVEGIKHEMQSGAVPWVTTLTLSPVDPATYFTLGSSVLGGPDLLFF